MSLGVLNEYFDSKHIAEFLVFDFNKTGHAGVIQLMDDSEQYGWFALAPENNDKIDYFSNHKGGVRNVGHGLSLSYQIATNDKKRLKDGVRLHKRVSRLLIERYSPTMLNKIGVWI